MAASGADDGAVTPLHVAIVHLDFARAPTAAALLATYPVLTRFCRDVAATGLVRVSVLGRFWRDEDVEVDGVRYLFRGDASAPTHASPFTRPVALYRLLGELAPDVVHLNGFVFPVQVAELRWHLPSETPLVIQHHGERPHRWWRVWAQRATRSCVDGFLFSADAIADPWRGVGAIGPRQPVLTVLESSSPLSPVSRTEARTETGVHGDPAVLWVGRLHAAKDPMLALDAFDRARTHLLDPHFFLVFHEDQLLPELRAACGARPGLAERVHFVGAMPHARLSAWFSAADLFLSTSPAEGSNLALIESLSCGLLPVCSDNPANRLVTGEGAAGVLFAYGDAAGGAEALVGAAKLAAREGDAGRARIRAHFDAHLSGALVARQAIAAWRTVVAARRQRARPRGIRRRAPFV
jgi:glycosyltransferase involved in cell wall biosynthesis